MAHLEDTSVRVFEVVEERRGHVKVSVVAGGALVLDSRSRSLAVGYKESRFRAA